jgi:hypothetical protein
MMKKIPLSKGKVAFVDDEDYDFLIGLGTWYCHSAGYAEHALPRPRRGSILMHRVIMQRMCPGYKGDVDHRNTNALDNRRRNLRQATKRENARNRGPQRNNKTGFKGVSFEARRQKYVARIKTDTYYKFLGYFATPIEAADAYQKAAHKYHGEFARV